MKTKMDIHGKEHFVLEPEHYEPAANTDGAMAEHLFAEHIQGLVIGRCEPCADVLGPDGRIWEVKCMIKGRPSLGGKDILVNQPSIRAAIENYFHADGLAVARWYQKDKRLEWTILEDKEEIVQFLLDRAILAWENDDAKNGFPKLRLGKEPRTQAATEKLESEGFYLG